jgi:hypothetical protein
VERAPGSHPALDVVVSPNPVMRLQEQVKVYVSNLDHEPFHRWQVGGYVSNCDENNFSIILEDSRRTRYRLADIACAAWESPAGWVGLGAGQSLDLEFSPSESFFVAAAGARDESVPHIANPLPPGDYRLIVAGFGIERWVPVRFAY